MVVSIRCTGHVLESGDWEGRGGVFWFLVWWSRWKLKRRFLLLSNRHELLANLALGLNIYLNLLLGGRGIGEERKGQCNRCISHVWET